MGGIITAFVDGMVEIAAARIRTTTIGTECRCHDPRIKCGGFCRRLKWYKDGLCDPGNNNCGCGWDGGDCCGINQKGTAQYGYCKLDCYCKDPSHKLWSSKRGAKCDGKCGKFPWTKGDEICDDQHNNCGCNWDGGDCCRDKSGKNRLRKERCKECKCHNPISANYDF